MTRTVSSQRVAARPIRALIIQPHNNYEVRVIQQDTSTFRRLVGGHFDSVSTEHCTYFCNKHGQREGLPHGNRMATYLWWKLVPEMEGRDALGGTVFVTGPADDCFDSLPVSDEVVELYERLEKIRKEGEGARQRQPSTCGTVRTAAARASPSTASVSGAKGFLPSTPASAPAR